MSLKTKPSGILTDREAEAGYKRNLSSRHIQMIALGEMSVAEPVSGAFSFYAYKH